MAHVTLPKNAPLENRARLPAARHGGNAGVACPVAEPPVPAANDSGVSGPGAVLALDLGTATGWALRDEYGAITSGTVSFRPDRAGARSRPKNQLSFLAFECRPEVW